ncbi:hypothetical protein CHISP_3501 [Chitinispirillum alkaliphilum]|nr:hypothetical protein CHISP_3501 [Chitinispirillum alkaliphilum]
MLEPSAEKFVAAENKRYWISCKKLRTGSFLLQIRDLKTGFKTNLSGITQNRAALILQEILANRKGWIKSIPSMRVYVNRKHKWKGVSLPTWLAIVVYLLMSLYLYLFR